MKIARPLLFLASLALMASCSHSVLGPAGPDSLEILSSLPEQDSLVVGEGDSLVFQLRARGRGALQAEARLDGETLCQSDSLVFRAWEHLGAQAAHADSFLTLEISVRDSIEELSRSWKMKILWGFAYFPADSEIVNVLGQTLVFTLHLEAGGMSPAYEFYMDGQQVGSGSESYNFQALQIGRYEILGKVLLGDRSWSHHWTVEVQPGDPVDPPETVSALRAGPGSAPGRLAVAFLPPAEGLREPVHSYEIRAFPYLIDDEQWETAYLIGVEEKTPDAQEERFDLPGPAAGMNLYVRVRSVGESGNTSPWCEPALGRVAGYTIQGRLWDFESGDPIEGMSVQYGDVISASDSEGRFYCDDVPLYEEDGPWDFPGSYFDESGPELGQWYDLLDSRAVADSQNYRMGTFSPEPFTSSMYTGFLDYFLQTLRPPPSNFHLIRPIYPLMTYIPERHNGNLSYADVIEQSMEVWESSSGLDLFERVLDPEEATLTFVYDDTTSLTGITRILEWDLDTLTPLKQEITLRGDVAEEFEHGLYQVSLHELGHAIGYWIHSNDTRYVMNKSNQQDAPHPDELRLIRIIYHMEPYEDLSYLLRD